MKIYEQIIAVCNGKEGRTFTSSQIIRMVSAEFDTNRSSVIPSDYCYNRTNKGMNFEKQKHLFEVNINKNEFLYTFLGEGCPYSGKVFWKRKGEKIEQAVGEWINGEYQNYMSEIIKVNPSIVSEYLKKWESLENYVLQEKSFKKEDLKSYNTFIDIILKFKKSYQLEKFSLREIDIFLWLAGKKYFPKKYKAFYGTCRSVKIGYVDYFGGKKDYYDAMATGRVFRIRK